MDKRFFCPVLWYSIFLLGLSVDDSGSCKYWLASGSNESTIHVHDLSSLLGTMCLCVCFYMVRSSSFCLCNILSFNRVLWNSSEVRKRNRLFFFQMLGTTACQWFNKAPCCSFLFARSQTRDAERERCSSCKLTHIVNASDLYFVHWKDLGSSRISFIFQGVEFVGPFASSDRERRKLALCSS